MRKLKGFTLIEILIAIFIFAIISMIGTMILSSVFNARKHTDMRMQQLNTLQIATILLRRDLRQLVNRPIRAANGNIIPAIVVQASSTAAYIEFTRTGNSNPFGMLQRSNLKRVAYHITHGELIRMTWPRLDRVGSTVANSRVLLTGITSGSFSFLGKGTTFYPNWPPGNLLSTNSVSTIPIPRAIAIHLQLKNWGNYYLLVPIQSSQL